MGLNCLTDNKLIVGDKVIHRRVDKECNLTILSFGRFRFKIESNIPEEHYINSLTRTIGYYDLLRGYPIDKFEVTSDTALLDLPQSTLLGVPSTLQSENLDISMNILKIYRAVYGSWEVCSGTGTLLTMSCRLCIKGIIISPKIGELIKKVPLLSYISTDSGIVGTVFDIVVPSFNLKDFGDMYSKVRETMINLYLDTLTNGKDIYLINS